MGSGHIKVKKGIRHLFYMAIPRHTIESVPGLVTAYQMWITVTKVLAELAICYFASLTTSTVDLPPAGGPDKNHALNVWYF